jgi:hypothetical protein
MSVPIFQDPKFDALRNAIYHTARSKYFDLWNRIFNFIVIVLGATVVGKLATPHAGFDTWIEFGIVFVAALQLVFDFGGRAGTHAFLQKRYYDVLADMEMSSDVESPKAIKKWSAKLLTIAGDETITMRALDAVAYNSALDSITTDPELIRGNRLHVPLRHRILKQFIAFQGTQFVSQSAHRGIFSRLMGKDNGKEKKG